MNAYHNDLILAYFEKYGAKQNDNGNINKLSGTMITVANVDGERIVWDDNDLDAPCVLASSLLNDDDYDYEGNCIS